jgi:branched-chain amino acid transport system permease protein
VIAASFSELAQLVVDGLGKGSTYALLALGLAVVFGVMHLLNFAHGELITVAAYAVYGFSLLGFPMWALVPVALAAATVTAVATEQVAFRWVRKSSPFTMLLTSFGVSVLIQAIIRTVVSDKNRKLPQVGWRNDSVVIAGIRFEVYDLVVIGVTLVVLVLVAAFIKKTMVGISLRAAAEDFDAARLVGVRANRAFTTAFALSGLLAGIAALLILIRSPEARPSMGQDPMLKAVVATIIGGLGSMGGAVLGGLVLGLAEVFLRRYLPGELPKLTEGFVFILIALLMVVKPHGLINVEHAERV